MYARRTKRRKRSYSGTFIPIGPPRRGVARRKSKGVGYRKPAVLNARTGGFLGIETKFIDYTFSAGVVATLTGAEMDPPGAGAQTTPGSISAIAQGDGESNRDGRKCTLTSLHIKGDLRIGPAAGATLQSASIVRVAVVWDTQTNAKQLNAEDVFLAATHIEHSFRNLQFSKRFKILKDATFVLNTLAGAGDGAANDSADVIKNFKWNFKLNIPVIHKSTTAVVASITDNSLHVIAFSNNTAATLSYESRIRFVG